MKCVGDLSLNEMDWGATFGENSESILQVANDYTEVGMMSISTSREPKQMHHVI